MNRPQPFRTPHAAAATTGAALRGDFGVPRLICYLLLQWHNLAVADRASTSNYAMTESLIALNPRGDVDAQRACVRRMPYAIEHVVSSEGGFDFAWSGASAYLALHDIVLNDGGMAGDDVAPVRVLDMRRRMTFLPHGVRVAGWCEPVARNNAFSVLYFDQDWLRTVATDTNDGRLTEAQLGEVRDFVDAHLADDISVAELATLTHLSVFHFTRKFKSTTGVAPYRYVLEARAERAKVLIQSSALPLATIAELTGFSSPSHFSRSFTEIVGVSPGAFRRSRRS